MASDAAAPQHSAHFEGDALLSDLEYRKLKWRCRRGLLENDLLIERFFKQYGDDLTVDQGQAMRTLMQLHDGDLLDLLLRRTQLSDEMNTPDIRRVLDMLRPQGLAAGKD